MEQAEYKEVKSAILKTLNIDLDHYKEQQMIRRLDSWLSRVGAKSWADYFVRIKSEEVEFRRFRDYITINVTEFYRDLERWDYLKNTIIPVLLRNSKSGLKIWSAGCSKGAEIYSLAMIMRELTPGQHHEYLATDLDKGALEIAKNGGPYVAEEIRNISPVEKSKYFLPDGPPYYLNTKKFSGIKITEQDLLKDKFENNFDLVVCRNVVIYFTSETKKVLYKKFTDSLKPGGIFFVGGTEIIPKSHELGLKSVGFSFYQKLAE